MSIYDPFASFGYVVFLTKCQGPQLVFNHFVVISSNPVVCLDIFYFDLPSFKNVSSISPSRILRPAKTGLQYSLEEFFK